MSSEGIATYGIVGFGKIGRRLAQSVPAAVVLARPRHAEEAERLVGSEQVCTTLEAFLARKPPIVVECASRQWLAELGATVLAAGIDLVPLSLTAFADLDVATTTLSAPHCPNGCHICEVEIDIDTGELEIVGYWVVDDVGRIINSLLVKGQMHGGIAQGLGQAIGECIRYDNEGQLVSASFQDYSMPRAADMPWMGVESNEVPATTNALGIKGAGEAGTVGALPAAMNAISHALAPLGIRHFDMPATPDRPWAAIEASKSQRHAG